MKKFLLVLLAATATLSFTGCQKEDNSQKAEEAELDAVSSSLSGTLVKYTGTEIPLKLQKVKLCPSIIVKKHSLIWKTELFPEMK